VVVDGVRYALDHLHWHTPAEHLLDGQRFALEQHLVHRDAEGHLLVLGVLLRAGPRNAALARLFAHLPERGAAERAVEELDLRALLPAGGRAFRYRGSLTTSPFTEGVQFVIYAQPVTLSAGDLARFQALFPKGNARQVQDLGERVPELGAV
jgi:carbonic anhydrase